MSYNVDVAVDWGKRGNYIAKHGIAVTDVNEALADPDRVVLASDPKSTCGRSLEVELDRPTSLPRRKIMNTNLDRLLRDEAQHAEAHMDDDYEVGPTL